MRSWSRYGGTLVSCGRAGRLRVISDAPSIRKAFACRFSSTFKIFSRNSLIYPGGRAVGRTDHK
ncbi:hypothetical protein KCP74_25615 (plasmid) [Salmonella enterica subsp. enterica]|nr:hypothetical protein KCP74_25615 [Salmonella enterica subsp. enterica]QUJ01293.1 hypothetical protein KCP73_26925 [Salmonella enterica subsp. enterica]